MGKYDLTEDLAVDAAEAPGEFSKSLRAGAYGARSQLQSAAGLVGEALGFDEFAKNRNADAAELQTQVQANAPRIGSYKQVLDSPDFSTGLRNAGDYVTGLVGSSLPIIGAGLVGGLVGGVGGGAAAAGRAIAGAATATLPFNVGDVTQKQLADPEAMKAPAGTRLRDAGLSGVGASLIDGVVPGMVAGKILGQGAKQAASQTLRQTAGRNLASVPMEGAAEAGSETIKQYGANQDKAFDVEAIKEAAVGGAAAGTVFAGVGTAADVAHGNAAAVGNATRSATSFVGDAASKLADRAKSSASTTQAEAPKKFKTVSEDIGELIAKGRQYADDSIDKVMTGQPFVDAQTFTTEAGQKFSDNERVKAATKWADDIASDAGLTPERREQAAAFAANVGDQASQVSLAALKKTVDAGRSIAEKIQRLHGSFKRGDVDAKATEVSQTRIGKGDITDVTPIKKSADYSGANRAITERMGLLIEANPGLADRPEAVAQLADSIRQAVETLPSEPLNSDTIARLIDVLGDQTRTTLTQAYRAVKADDPAAADVFFKKLNETVELQQRSKSIKDLVIGSLSDSAKTQIRPQQYSELVENLMKHARGEYDNPNAGPNEIAARNLEFREILAQTFGDKADAVSLAIEKEAKLSKGVEADVKEGDFDEGGERITAEALDIKQFGYGKANAAVMDSAVFRSTGQQGPDRAAQLLLDIKTKYPDHDVTFERMPGSDMGHVIATPTESQNPDGFSKADLQGMRLDTKKYSNSPDRLEIKTPDGKLILDTRRIASVMDKRLPYSQDAQPRAERLAEMFKEGVARLQEQYGAFDVADTVVIGRAGGKDLTFGEIKKLDPRTEADRAYDKVTQDLVAKREEYKTASPADKKRIKEEADALNAEREKTKARELTAERDYGAEKDESVREAGKDAQIHEAAKDNASGDLVNRSNMDGSARFTNDRDNPENMKPARTLIHALRDGETAIGRKIADRLETLLAHTGKMAERDRLKLAGLGKDLSASQTAEIINPIATKYKDVITKTGDVKAAEPVRAKEVAPSSAVDLKTARERLEYLKNPPDDYTTEQAAEYVAAAKKQAALIREKLKTLDPNEDAYDSLDDLRFTLDQVVKKGESVIENDAAALAEFGEDTPSPKSPAAKKAALLAAASSSDPALLAELSTTSDARALQRTVAELPPGAAADAANARMAELVQDPNVAYDLTKKYSLESANGPEKLITRLADQRADRVLAADAQGKYHRLEGTISFGPIRHAVTYVAANAESSHAFVVPAELIPKAEELLAKYPAKRPEDVLAVVAVQHAFYVRNTHEFESFGPDPRSYAGKLLEQLGALGDTGETFQTGQKVTRVEGVSAKETVSFLADALAYAKHVEGKDKIPVYWERLTGGNKGKTGGGIFSAEKSGNSKTDTAATRADIQDYITKVLGDSVKVKFVEMSHAGEFERMRLHDIIRLSTTALDPMSTAHHEALHAFFAQLRDAKANDVMGVLQKAADSENVIRQLNELYKNNGPVLAQLKDPEERVAYMYQHWAAGNLTIGFQPRSILARVAEFIRGVLGIWSNNQRALAILEHFNSGEYAASGRDVGATQQKYIQGGRNQALEAAKSFTAPMTRLADAVVSTGSGRVRDTGIPALIRLADIIKRSHTDGKGGDQGFIAAARVEATKRNSALAEALKDYNQDELHEAMEALQRGRGYNGANAVRIREAQAIIKATLADTRGYLLAAGVDIGNLGPDYFPRIWDSHYISQNQQAFKDMLEPYIRRGEHKGSADDLIRDLMAHEGSEFGVERKKLDFDEVKARPPGMQFKKTRTLAYITPEDAAMFVNKDLLGTLTTYIHQAARKAEWSRRLGNGKLEALVEDAKKEGATPEQLKMTDTYLQGIDGTLGDSINPHARRIMGNMIVYQNIRLLPFAVFSSIIDPMGVMVRGGTMRDAFATFKRGISEIPKGLGKQSADDRATEITELVGVIDSAVLASTLGDVYTQGMVGGFAKKANSLFFKFNLMEGLNRSFRIGASEAAIKFIARHADGKDSKHSQRWINELGLQAGDIIPTADGRIALTTSEGLSIEQERRVHAAINQWVDGAVLRPDAADKPIWFNDPHWALVSHLKQFVYSFQKTILERVVHEYKQGNNTPAMALASYVPMMMAADFVKGMIQGGGEQPEWKKGWSMVDYTTYAVQRAGLFGVGQFGLDMAKDVREGGVGVGALWGPTVEQFVDVVGLLGGHKQFGPMVLNALPANALYKNAFNQEAPDSAIITK